jgi:aspartyl-tRNA(Asn)/glutamyl-tRNA(Gln) amidotransferase subunit A
LIREKTEEILKEYDFILTPTAPEPAFPLGKTEKDPVVTYLYDIFTVQASLSGMPAISLPAGNNSNGLPLGLQLLTRQFEEQELLNFSKYVLELN